MDDIVDLKLKVKKLLDEAEGIGYHNGRIESIKEILHEMIMFEHRTDINNFQSRWNALKERLEELNIK